MLKLGDLKNVEIEHIESNEEDYSEAIAKKYYVEKGFNVFKLNKKITLKQVGRFNYDIICNLLNNSKKGMPDFIVINKELNNYFLVEVKSNEDGIKYNQFLWYKKHPSFSIKILFVIKESKFAPIKVDEEVWEKLKAKVGYDGCKTIGDVIKLLLEKGANNG